MLLLGARPTKKYFSLSSGQVRLDQGRLGQVKLGQVRLGQVRLGFWSSAPQKVILRHQTNNNFEKSWSSARWSSASKYTTMEYQTNKFEKLIIGLAPVGLLFIGLAAPSPFLLIMLFLCSRRQGPVTEPGAVGPPRECQD